MSRPFSRKELWLWLVLPLSLIVAVIVGTMLAKRGGRVAVLAARAAKLTAAQIAPNEIDSSVLSATSSTGADYKKNLSDSLLTDSILSIIQNYYVDPNRVDNRGLLDAVIAALSTSSDIKVGEINSPVGGNNLWIEVQGQRREYVIPEKPDYHAVLAFFNNIAAFLDTKHAQIPTAEPTEKNAPGAVVLLNSLLSALDSHSALLSPDAYRELRQGTEGSFGGLGVLVGIRENLLTVIKPLPRSPAQRAGIQKRDRILGIDGVYTYGYTLDELVEYMRGDPGTPVKLSLLREGAIAPTLMTLNREIIHVDSVTSEEVVYQGSKVLHLTIENFASRTSREVLTAIKRSRLKHNGVLNGVILDLRSNPGGLLDQAVQVADLFLQKGVIVTTRGRREEVESAGSGLDEVDFPMVVLVDGDSASASEIVAGALQDHGRALVIGQPSFGKGSVQTIFELPGERALKLTIARYYTPDGRSIQNVGIIPDVWLQPIYKAKDNSNLLGTYRYKNERFLRNHLLGHADAKAMNDMSIKQPSRKVYYVEDTQPDPEDPVRKNDREMNLALQVIEKVRVTYGNKLPVEAARGSHWLGLAGPEIGKTMAKMGNESASWLKKKFGIEWPMTAPISPAADLSLEIVEESSESAITPGKDVNIAWTIKNNEALDLQRLSLFVRSDVGGFETKEVLIGTISAKNSKSGKLKISIPTYIDPGPMLLRVGVALDAWPALNASADLPIQIEPRSVADLSATAEISNEIGGKITGILEGLEKAKIRLNLANHGGIAAHDLKIYVHNLSGKQLIVSDKPQTLKELPVGGTSEAFVEIEAGKLLYTSELDIGIYIESPDLKMPLRKRVALPSIPSSGVPKGVESIGLRQPVSH